MTNTKTNFSEPPSPPSKSAESLTLGDWWGRHFLVAEWLLFTLVTASLIWLCESIWADMLAERLKGNRGQVYSALAGVFVSLLGLILAVATLVATHLSTNLPKLRQLRKYDCYEQLWEIFWSAFTWLGLGSIASLAAMLLDRDESTVRLLFYLVLWSFFGSVARVWRCVWVVKHIIRSAVPALPKDSTL